MLQKLGGRCKERVVFVGDMIVSMDAEANQLRSELKLKEGRYEGFSLGVPGNRL